MFVFDEKQKYNSAESCSSMPIGRFSLVDSLSPISCYLYFNFINKVMWTGLNNFYQQRFLQNMKKILSSTYENKKQLQQQYMFFDAYKPKEVNLKNEESTTKNSGLSLSEYFKLNMHLKKKKKSFKRYLCVISKA